MATYTIVKNGVVDNIIEADDAFILVNHTNDIAVRGRIPIGWVYKDGSFSSPTLITPDATEFVDTSAYTNPAIRIISTRAFLRRFSSAERKSVRESTYDAVIEMFEDLQFASYVDLDTIDLSGLVSLTYIGSERPAEILVNGTTEEKYNGTL